MVRSETHPLKTSPDSLKTDLQNIIRRAIAVCDPAHLVTRALDSVDASGRVWVVAAGKAAAGMAGAASRRLDGRLVGGLVVAPGPAGHLVPFDSRLEAIAGGHPIPTSESERAGLRALEIARDAGRDDTVLFLWSGGASALMAAPAAGVTLDDKQTTTGQLLRAGADIHTLNAVRKHLSALKGGRLAAATVGRCRTLAISDVVGDDLSVIASGPTVADETTFSDALDALVSHGGFEAFPARVVARLRAGARGEIEETPKPGDRRLSSGNAAVIGNRVTAMNGAADEAAALGYHVIRIDMAITGESRVAAKAYLDSVQAIDAPLARPVCIVSSGETTVRVTGGGRGGRNQEFALSLVEGLGRLGRPAAFASVGTDGVDGPTVAAGAVADNTSARRADGLGLDPTRFLDDNDSYAFFSSLGDLVRTGPTGTNVGDLQVLLLA